MGLHDCSSSSRCRRTTEEEIFGAESSKAKKSAGASLATSDSTQRNKGDNGSMMARLEKRENILNQLKQLKELMASEDLNREEFEKERKFGAMSKSNFRSLNRSDFKLYLFPSFELWKSF